MSSAHHNAARGLIQPESPVTRRRSSAPGSRRPAVDPHVIRSKTGDILREGVEFGRDKHDVVPRCEIADIGLRRARSNALGLSRHDAFLKENIAFLPWRIH